TDSQLIICMETMDSSMDRFYLTMHRIDQLQYLDQVLRRLAHNIVGALNYLKLKNIIHRNIKPQNILVNKLSIYKLCDSGISGQLQNFPPIINFNPIQYLSFEIAMGSQPFANDRMFEFYEKIQKWQPQIPQQTVGPDMPESHSL
ncbi:unnamed protein product, partial [Didymodactylos carnosus]